MRREEVRMCIQCVMDTTDRNIQFDEQGVCHHCKAARRRIESETFRGEEAQLRLERLVEKIKKSGKGKEYDCLIGLSGGVDSTYVAYRTKELGLRPLAVHLDNGWNSELAVGNIEKTVKKFNIDLVTVVVDWEEIKDLQRAFFKASVCDIEVVSDHAIFAALFHAAAKHRIRYILAGNNIATESIMAWDWGYDQRDARHILAIHRRFGERKLVSYPILRPPRLIEYVFVRGMKYVPVLNYIPYIKSDIVAFLKSEIGWEPYRYKHGESRFTHFFQNYYLPTKFGYDKRKAHFSSLIAAGQITRAEALEELAKPLYDPDQLKADKEYVLKKLGFSAEQFDEILAMPTKWHQEYPNNLWLLSHQRNPVTRWVRRFAKEEINTRGGLESVQHSKEIVRPSASSQFSGESTDRPRIFS